MFNKTFLFVMGCILLWSSPLLAAQSYPSNPNIQATIEQNNADKSIQRQALPRQSPEIRQRQNPPVVIQQPRVRVLEAL